METRKGQEIRISEDQDIRELISHDLCILWLKTHKAEGISHLFDTLKSAAQSEIKAYFVHASLEQYNNKRRPDGMCLVWNSFAH